MCPHDEFETLFEDDFGDIVVRKCKQCGMIEVKSEWVDIEYLRAVIMDID